MSVSDLDIERSALQLIRAHGAEAWTEACVRYFDLREKGDVEGMAVWSRIAHSIWHMATGEARSVQTLQ